MSMVKPKSLYHATFSSGSNPVSTSTIYCDNRCGLLMNLTRVLNLNKKEFEIRSLIQKNVALAKLLETQDKNINRNIRIDTYGTLPPLNIDVRDDAHQSDMHEEEHRFSLDASRIQHRQKDENMKQENKMMKATIVDLEKTIKTLTDEVAKYKEQLRTNEVLVAGDDDTNEKTRISIEDIKAKNTDLWKKWKKESYTVKCKDTLLEMQRQRMEEQENLLQAYEKKFPSGVVDIATILARVDEGERLWSKINTREAIFKERKAIIRKLQDEVSNLQINKMKLQEEADLIRNYTASLQLKLLETGDKIDMMWLLSQLRENALLKEKNAELEEIIAEKGYTIKALEAEFDFRRKEVDLATKIDEVNSVMENLKGVVKKDINAANLLNAIEVALLLISSEEDSNKQISELVHNNALLTDRVAELEESIQGHGYTVKAAAAERKLQAKEMELATKVGSINELLETLNDAMDGVDNTEITVLLRRLDKVLLSLSPNRADSMDIVTQHSLISDVGWNLGCVTFEPNDYAALAVGQSFSSEWSDDGM